MPKKERKSSIAPNSASVEIIGNMIYILRGHKVMLDYDLASLYGIETKYLKRAVRRNIERFPSDFLFELTAKEYESLRCQFGTLKRGQHSKYQLYAFTEQGVAMLSSVLNTKRAIQVNIAIMRTFIKLREMIATHKGMKRKIDDMEKKYDKQFKVVFTALKELLGKPKDIEKAKSRIGF